MGMKVSTQLLFGSLVLSSAWTVSDTSRDETLSRFVFTYKDPEDDFFANLSQVKSVDEYIDYIANQLNATRRTRIKNYTVGGLHFQVEAMTPDLAEAIRTLPFVTSLERDVQMHEMALNNSGVVQLSTEEIPYGITMVGALNVSDDLVANQIVCIIGSGYDDQHPDLPKNATGSDFGAGPWNQDGLQYGTHIAGTILALGGNGQGVVGIIRNGQVGVHIMRLYDDDGVTWAGDSLKAVYDCVANGANVVSMSYGRSEGGPLEFERVAFQQFFDDGVLLVASAGNQGSSQDNWPASYDSVISVAAIDENKNVADFSAFNEQVELAAPGVGVLSTIPGGQYAYFDGTSTACPHVSGVAALVWSHFPDKSSAEIRNALQQSAEDLGSPGRDVNYGFGLVRADLAYKILADGNIGTSVPAPPKSPNNDPVTEETKSTSSLVKAISISIGGLLSVVAMIIAAFFLNKKWNMQSHTSNVVAPPTTEHAMPSNAHAETVEAIPITTSYNMVYEPTPLALPASSTNHTIVAAVIGEPGNFGSPPMDFNIKVRKSMVPDYKDQVQSVAGQVRQNMAVPGLADERCADVIEPLQQGRAPTAPPRTQQQQQQLHKLPDP